MPAGTEQQLPDQAPYWNDYFRKQREAGTDLDWRGRWTEPFVPLMREHGVRALLELGCGTGNDAARLARLGFRVVATDFSTEAIDIARGRYAELADFRVVDMTTGLPFDDGEFDAAMSNVAMHMYSDRITRAIFSDVHRVLRPGGLFLFHVNATDDLLLEQRWRRTVREIEPDFVLQEGDRTARYFSRAYLDDLLADWQVLMMDHLEIPHWQTGEPFKRAWRVAARKTS